MGGYSPTVNEALQHASLSHDVDLQQFAAGVVQRMIALLNRTDADLAAQIRALFERARPATEFNVERLDALLSEVRALNTQAYAAVGRELQAQVSALAGVEAEAQASLLQSVLPDGVPFTIAAVSVDQVRAAALSQPFQGRLLREWMAGLEANRAQRIRDAVRMSFIEAETVEQLVRRIRGTRAAQWQDGILQTDRRDAEAVARTALAHVANVARDHVYRANDQLIKALVWSATLDTRTSPDCRARDGKQYEADTHKPIGHAFPWRAGPGRLHWRCRSSSYPVLKSWRELGIPMDDMSPGTRASMDGQVPAELSYGDWLKKQSASRQDEVLGPTRGKLMRSGLSPEFFYSNRGEYLTLEQLRERNAALFRRAGV